MRISLALIAVFLMAGPAFASAPADTPEKFVNAIYSHYTDDPDNSHGIYLNSEKAVRQYFAPSLSALIIEDDKEAQQRDEVPALDGDPFIDAQEWNIKSFDISVEPKGADKAEAAVAFKNYGERKNLKLFLVRLPEGWRIDDIQWNGDEGTLRGLYDDTPRDEPKDEASQ